MDSNAFGSCKVAQLFHEQLHSFPMPKFMKQAASFSHREKREEVFKHRQSIVIQEDREVQFAGARCR